MANNERLIEYYDRSVTAYSNWSQTGGLEPPSCHCGFHPEGNEIGQKESISLMTDLIIDKLNLTEQPNGIVVDAGCGFASLGYRIAKQTPFWNVVGINLNRTQLVVAKGFVATANLNNLILLESSFDNLPMDSNSVDKIVFCESLCHSQNQSDTLKEAKRVLKPGGQLFIADAYINPKIMSEEEGQAIYSYQTGWMVPELRTIGDFGKMVKELGFNINNIQDLSKEVLPSMRRFGLNAQKRLNEAQEADPIIQESRKACVGSWKLMESGAVNYSWIICSK